jgi:hypothetical protein
MDIKTCKETVASLPNDIERVYIATAEGPVPLDMSHFKICRWKSEDDECPLFLTDEQKVGWDADRKAADPEDRLPPLVRLEHPVLLLEASRPS